MNKGDFMKCDFCGNECSEENSVGAGSATFCSDECFDSGFYMHIYHDNKYKFFLLMEELNSEDYETLAKIIEVMLEVSTVPPVMEEEISDKIKELDEMRGITHE